MDINWARAQAVTERGAVRQGAATVHRQHCEDVRDGGAAWRRAAQLESVITAARWRVSRRLPLALCVGNDSVVGFEPVKSRRFD